MTTWCPDLGARRGPKYIAIADALAQDVTRGTLAPGVLLPTHRDLADALGVTVGTVSRAYALARRRGLVTAEVGRGTFVAAVRGERLPLAPAHDETPGGVIEMGSNLPFYACEPDLEAALRELADTGELARLLRYGPPGGLPEQRVAAVRWAEGLGAKLDAERLVVTVGAQQAIIVALSAALEAGERVLFPALTYPGAFGAARTLGLEPMPVALDADGLSPESLDRVCQTTEARMLCCVPTLSSPLSGTLALERREAIVDVARNRNLWLLEDLTYTSFAVDRPPTFSELAPERTFSIVSLSKAVAGGLRVGFLHSPPSRQAAAIHRLWTTSLNAPALTTEIARRWIEDGTATRVALAKRELAQRRRRIAAELLGGFGLRQAEHAPHAWLPMPEGWTSDAFVAEARRRQVAITPAREFAVGRDGYPDGVRICLGAVGDDARLTHGLTLLAEILQGLSTRRFWL